MLSKIVVKGPQYKNVIFPAYDPLFRKLLEQLLLTWLNFNPGMYKYM